MAIRAALIARFGEARTTCCFALWPIPKGIPPVILKTPVILFGFHHVSVDIRSMPRCSQILTMKESQIKTKMGTLSDRYQRYAL
jgi:hypothetical protein